MQGLFVWFCVTLRPQRGPWPPHFWGFMITHNDAPQSVGLLWTSDQLVAETSTWQHTTPTTDKHSCPLWDSNPRSQQASGRAHLRLRPRGPWDRRHYNIGVVFTSCFGLLLLLLLILLLLAKECNIKWMNSSKSFSFCDRERVLIYI